MNKQQAYEAMRDGYKVRNEYYTPEEFAFINSKGLIEFEDGIICSKADWDKYQDPHSNYEWEVVGEADKFLHANRERLSSIKNDLSATSLPNKVFIDDPVQAKKPKRGTWKPVEPASDIHRNDPCMCGSGKKYKKCCGI